MMGAAGTGLAHPMAGSPRDDPSEGETHRNAMEGQVGSDSLLPHVYSPSSAGVRNCLCSGPLHFKVSVRAALWRADVRIDDRRTST